MCIEKKYRDPEKTLALLFKKETGIDVPASVMRMFIRSKWEVLAALAHSIHGKGAAS